MSFWVGPLFKWFPYNLTETIFWASHFSLASKTKGMTMRPTSSSVGAGNDLMPMALRIFSNHAASNKEAADVSSCGASDEYFQGISYMFYW